MKRINRNRVWANVVLIIATLLQASCSMMKEDLSDCPDCRNLLRITLRYDYNTQRANMFSDHVEEVMIFIVDAATGTVVDTLTACNTTTYQSLRNPSFGFNIEGLTPGNYRLYATGRSAAETSFTTSVPGVGQPMSQLQYSVPADANGEVPALRLDTIWNTLNPVAVDVSGSEPVEAVIPLMRLTNDLNVMVFCRDHPTDNGHERYEVLVTDNHPTLGYDNAPAPESQSVVYRPFASWTTETSADSTIAERNAHYDLSLARLIQHEDARQNPRLIIRNRTTGHQVVNIDLCYYLALARNAYEIQHYGIQEYLDREYDYRLDFGIEGEGNQENWKYMTIRINVLDWAIRIQNETL